MLQQVPEFVLPRAIGVPLAAARPASIVTCKRSTVAVIDDGLNGQIHC
jgi:hypothetical protein